MSNFARIINDAVVDVSSNPAEQFHPSIAADFQPVPDEVRQGWKHVNGTWQAPEQPVAPPGPAAPRPQVSPIQFKLLWASPERLTLKAARASDPVLDDFFDIIEDPRLTHIDLGLTSTQQGIDYCMSKLVAANVLQSADVPARREQILSGQFQ